MAKEIIYVDDAIAKLKKNFSQLGEKEIKAGIASAINRSLQFGKTEGSRQIKNSYNIKQSLLADQIETHKARVSLLIGEIAASSQAINLSHFQPTFSFTKKSKTSYSKTGVGVSKLLKKDSTIYGKGVTVEIIKGNRTSIPYAFMIAGKKPVFARGEYEKGGKYAFIKRHQRTKQSGSDTPITSLVNVSVYSSLVNNKVMPQVSDKVTAKFEERMVHELNYRLGKMEP